MQLLRNDGVRVVAGKLSHLLTSAVLSCVDEVGGFAAAFGHEVAECQYFRAHHEFDERLLVTFHAGVLPRKACKIELVSASSADQTRVRGATYGQLQMRQRHASKAQHTQRTCV